MVDWLGWLLCFLTALAAGAVNSIAGGGTLLTFPLLIWLGLDGKTANATSTIGLWAGSLAGALGYRSDLAQGTTRVVPFFVSSLIGGSLGSLLLLFTDSDFFDAIVPWLILTATLLFASQTAVRRWMNTHQHEFKPTRMPTVVMVQFIVGVYGGYFGAGMGILMLAILGFLGLTNIHQMNGIKNLAATAINGVTILIFSVASHYRPNLLRIDWPLAGLMIAGSIIGGYGSAGLAKRVGPVYVRRAVIVIGLVGAAGTAYKTWFATP